MPEHDWLLKSMYYSVTRAIALFFASAVSQNFSVEEAEKADRSTDPSRTSCVIHTSNHLGLQNVIQLDTHQAFHGS